MRPDLRKNRLRTMMLALAAAAHLLAVCQGCGLSAEEAVGMSCSTDADCSDALDEGYCPNAAVCTRHCTNHSDCGCDAETTNGDIAAGKCKSACVGTTGSSKHYCLRVCSSNGDCEGSTSCEFLNSYSVCTP